MRTVLLVTRHQDVSRLSPELESAGFSAPAITPERLASNELESGADVVVLDLRDIPPAAFTLLSSTYAENGTILMVILAPMAAMLVQMAISRSREYEADRGGAEILGRPMVLASALGSAQASRLGDSESQFQRSPG